MTSDQDHNFRRLLSAWNEHRALRQMQAPLDQLADSRWRLDALRIEAHRISS